MDRVLLIANRTCPCPVVHDTVAERVRPHEDHEVRLVAPALTGRLAYWVSDVDPGRREARGRVEQALLRLHAWLVPAGRHAAALTARAR